jgi:hypothetical protein
MPRRPAVLLTSPCYIADFPIRTLLHSLYTSFAYKNEAHPLSSQPLPHLYTKTTGCNPHRFSNSADLSQPSNLRTCQLSNALSPLSATLTVDLRVLAEISRNWPPASPLDATLTESTAVTPLDATLIKKPGEAPLAIATKSLPSVSGRFVLPDHRPRIADHEPRTQLRQKSPGTTRKAPRTLLL